MTSSSSSETESNDESFLSKFIKWLLIPGFSIVAWMMFSAFIEGVSQLIQAPGSEELGAGIMVVSGVYAGYKWPKDFLVGMTLLLTLIVLPFYDNIAGWITAADQVFQSIARLLFLLAPLIGSIGYYLKRGLSGESKKYYVDK